MIYTINDRLFLLPRLLLLIFETTQPWNLRHQNYNCDYKYRKSFSSCWQIDRWLIINIRWAITGGFLHRKMIFSSSRGRKGMRVLQYRCCQGVTPLTLYRTRKKRSFHCHYGFHHLQLFIFQKGTTIISANMGVGERSTLSMPRTWSAQKT